MRYDFAGLAKLLLSFLFLLAGMFCFMMAIGRLPEWVDAVVLGESLPKRIGTRPFPYDFIFLLGFLFFLLTQFAMLLTNKSRFWSLHALALRFAPLLIAMYLGIFVVFSLYKWQKIDLAGLSFSVISTLIYISLFLFFIGANYLIYRKIKPMSDAKSGFGTIFTYEAATWVNVSIYLVIFQWIVIKIFA